MLGYATADVGPGPFYVVLGEGAGYYSSGSPNQAYWSNLQVTGSNNSTPPTFVALANAGNTVDYAAGAQAAAIDPALSISGSTGINLTSATVAISSGFLAGDTLNFTNQNGISGSFDNATGVLTLSGAASLADYQRGGKRNRRRDDGCRR